MLKQSSDGYKYSIDAFLLADFYIVNPGPANLATSILDLGAGCGIVTYLLSRANQGSQFTCIEIQPELIGLAKENLQSKNVRLIKGDIRKIQDYCDENAFDTIVTNPPYHKIGSGRINKHPGKASARHEITGELRDFIKAGKRVLKPNGLFYIIFTANRAAELINELIQNAIEPKIIRNIHPRQGSEANLMLIKAVKMGRPGVKILPPMFIYTMDGEYSDEVAGIFKRFSFKQDSKHLP